MPQFSRLITEVEQRQGAEAVRDHRRHVQRQHRLLDSTHARTGRWREDQMHIFFLFFYWCCLVGKGDGMGRLVAHQDEHLDVLAASDVVERLHQPGQPAVHVVDRVPARPLRHQSIRDSGNRPACQHLTTLSQCSFFSNHSISARFEIQ